MMNTYEQKKAARIERMRERAERKRAASAASYDAAKRIADVIPMGQPILVGHHSERRHRRDLDKIDRGMRASIDASREADALERRADFAESNRAISSDDPDAVTKLRAKVEDLEKQRELAKKINRAVRSKSPRAALEALGLKERTIENALTKDFAGRLGVPSYQLTNWGSEIRRLKGRIEQLERQATTPEIEPETIGEIEVREEENRVRLIFPAKPSADVRTKLKRYGFRWSPMAGAWQRMASPSALELARTIAKSNIHGE